MLVPPTLAMMPAGSRPAALSLSIAASSSAASMPRSRPLPGSLTRLSSPMPATQMARSIDVCTSAEQ